MESNVRRLTLAALLSAAATSRALDIQFTVDANGISAEGLAGFQTAASIWESVLHDDITTTITIGVYDFGAANANVIGQSGSNYVYPTYTAFRAAMAADAQSAADAAVLATLPTGSTYSRLINQTNDTPGPDYFKTWTDSQTDWLFVGRANAKALGLIDPHAAGEDSAISFNSAFAFDYDRSDGIAAGKMDFIGVALHEIGHSLGFGSVADWLEYYSGNAYEFASMPLDFLRYSTASLALGIPDVSIGTTAKFLSINGTTLAMSTGVSYGDGQQASHFKDNLGLGLMDPTASYNETINITANDLLAMDAIGWNLVATPVPEPSTYGLALGGLALGLAAFRRRRA